MRRIENKSICVGLDNFIDKIGYQSDVYIKNGEKIRYLVIDTSGTTRFFSNKYKADVVILGKTEIVRFFQTIKEIILYKPNTIEIYISDLPRFWDNILAPLCKLLRIRLILFLRGTEFISSYRIHRLKVLYPYLDLIISKEMHLTTKAIQMGFLSKLEYLHNGIPIKKHQILDYSERKIDILFLNSPRKERNVLFLIEVIYKLLKKTKIKLNIVMAGFSVLDNNNYKVEPSYQKEVLNRIKELGLENDITILGFVDNAEELLKHSKIFIFPANIVFCNYALLEAMSFGCVPIVANGEGAYWIINNLNGFVSKLEVDSFINSISTALNIKIWRKKSEQAILTVEKYYSIDDWYTRIKQIKGKKT